MEPYELIEGFAQVKAAFGGWPSFHDAEVHRIVLQRASSTGPLPTVEVVIHAWNMSNEIDANGYYRLTHQHLVTFAFEDVSEVQIDGFNQQNVLSDLLLEPVDDSLRVELVHCFGVSGSFIAKRSRVVAITPYDSKRK